MTISFNGETTQAGRLTIGTLADTLTGRVSGSSAQDAANSLRDALEELSTISSVAVTASGTTNATTQVCASSRPRLLLSSHRSPPLTPHLPSRLKRPRSSR